MTNTNIHQPGHGDHRHIIDIRKLCLNVPVKTSHDCTCVLVYLCTELPVVVIDSYPPVTAVEQGKSIVLVCRVVGVLPSVTLSYSWTCDGGACMGTEVVSGNRLRIGVINKDRHRGAFICSVTGSGVSLKGTFDLTVDGELETSAKYLEIPS